MLKKKKLKEIVTLALAPRTAKGVIVEEAMLMNKQARLKVKNAMMNDFLMETCLTRKREKR